MLLLIAAADTFGIAATGSLLGRWVGGVRGWFVSPRKGPPARFPLSEVRLRPWDRVWVLAAT